MTHESVIEVNGRILGAGPVDPAPTAVAWAADRILAVGPEDSVRAISRGDSTFVDLGGRAVTPAPTDPAAAEAAVRAAEATGAPFDLLEVLFRAGQLEPGAGLEPGDPADLAVRDAGPPGGPAGSPGRADPGEGLRVVALVVRHGAFTEGGEHRGPLPPAPPAAGAGTR